MSAPTETDPLIRPNNPALYELEVRRRKRFVLALTLISVFCAVFGALLVWLLSVMAEERRAERPAYKATLALDKLNHHLVTNSSEAKLFAKGCESTLLLFRHCEKQGAFTKDEDGNEHCSYLGSERASHLATLFGDSRSSRWPVPANLFALSPGRVGHLNFREWETLQPLSRQTGVVTEIADQASFAEQYFALLQSGELCGKVTLVSWEHVLIPELALDLACGPNNGCPGVYPDESFDEIWQLIYVFHPDEYKSPDEEAKEDELKNTSNIPIVEENGDDDVDGEEEDDYTVEHDDYHTNGTHRRRLRKRKHHAVRPHYSKYGWSVYATVTYQNFDPLAYNKKIGNY